MRRRALGLVGAATAAAVLVVVLHWMDDTSTPAADPGLRTTTSTVPTTVAAGTVGFDQVAGAEAIQGKPSGAPIAITAVRTDRTTRDVVIEYTDVAPERSVLQGMMEGPPLASDMVVGVCTLGYTVSLDDQGPVPRLSVRAVVDSSRRTVAERAGHPCVPTGLGALLRAHLPRPLVGTAVIDAATGATVPLFDGATLLRPTVLPAAVTWNLQWAGEGGWHFGYSDGFHQPPGIGIRLLQGYTSPPPGSVGLLPIRQVSVGGHPAQLLASGAIRALTWTHGRSPVMVILQPVSPTGPDDALDPVLFAFAAGLR